MTRQETGGNEISYLDAGEFNRIIEISCRKNNYKVQCYKNDSLSSIDSKRSFKTLAAAKRHGEKWMKKQVDIAMGELTAILEG